MDARDSPLEIWGGLECTLNRVGSRQLDQLEFSGHYRRWGDLERFASLGIRALRFPVLWERWGQESDWSWVDRSLERLRELGVRPIVGLVHHGSGPGDDDLTQPGFAGGLARFAARVARRYPWVTDYTPVNEPLTTARFCGLYGHWYPHGRGDVSFVSALLGQCLGVQAAMRAIREVQPAARLVQTEDLGVSHSVPRLRYQASFENERRWLSLDLLCGKVRRGHPLWNYLLKSGVEPDRLRQLSEEPVNPDMLGLNYYVTSERFLDDRLERYPTSLHGGNARDRYVDVEAVRAGCAVGPLQLLQECWARYGTPLAITEAHLGCSREEQVRWLMHVWQAVQGARLRGVEVRALTCWALLGSFDWDSLVTQPRGSYETGAFDLRCDPPRPTAVARAVRQLVQGEQPDRPWLADPGWWELPRALVSSPILIAGGGGRLGQALAAACRRRGLAVQAVTHAQLDITDARAIRAAFERWRPWAVINAAGYSRIDRAEREQAACVAANVRGAVGLAEECRRRGVPLVAFSTDLVFAGELRRPYRESDRPSPLGVYGRSKYRAERELLRAHPQTLLIRSGALFGPWLLEEILATQRFGACPDVIVSPTYLGDLADAALDLLIDEEAGLWHLANQGAVSWHELAREIAARARLETDRVQAAGPGELGWVAPRPRFSALESHRGGLLPELERGIARLFQESYVTCA